MGNLHIISAQHGYLFKKSIESVQIFDLATHLKNIIVAKTSAHVSVDLQRFNISDVLFKLSWSDFSFAVSLNRADLFFASKYAPENNKEFAQVFGALRSVMSTLFSCLNSRYEINRLGLVVDYMFCEKDMTPSERINKIILRNKPEEKKLTVYSLEGQEVLSWKDREIFEVNRMWDAKYSVPERDAVVNLGIRRDVSIDLKNDILTDEEYREFLQFIDGLFTFESINKMVN